ncbi:MMPL family transporter [Epibacterium sp. SM1969]|uniref:MMPL family transporter n=1 Tax=Tritonibacter aquimaris TaxID=2663379 RepID=A0A844B1M9_9RHOB|nr:efflux RND transporter permease subunit [Tritonibacter aquimaris]MQY44242.1 MMPL family transporter [Tritonibacter aquimaris]
MSGPVRSEGWIGWFARNSVAANLLMLTILAMGLITGIGMRTETFPADPPRNVTVSVSFNGASPEDAEEGAAVKVEQALNGLQGVEKIISAITSLSAEIIVRGLPDYPMEQLKSDVKDRVDAITSFPAQMESTTISLEQEERHVLYVQLLGGQDHATLKEAAYRVRQALLDLPTVSKVTTEGSHASEITVQLDEAQLRAFGLSFEEVAQAVQGQSISLSGGTLEAENGSLSLQSRNQAYFGRDLLQTRIRVDPDGGAVRLLDVAHVTDGYAEGQLLSIYNGVPSIRLGVQLLGKDSITQTADAVLQKLEELQAAPWLPQDVTLHSWQNEAELIRDRLTLMSRNALTGMVLVFVMLALFLDVRVAFWVAVGIPVSFAGALYVMGPTAFDYSLNGLTTFGFIITLGIVVDDAIVTGENIYARKRADGGGVETAIRGALEVATPATFGVLTTVAAFYPLATISGDFSGAFKMIAVVVICCLLFSLVESRFILPAHLAHLDVSPRPKSTMLARQWQYLQSQIECAMQWVIQRLYLPVLRIALAHQLQAVMVFVACFLFALGLMAQGIVRTDFFPDQDSTQVHMDVTFDSGSSPARTRETATFFEASLLKVVQELEAEHSLQEPLVTNYYVSSTQAEKLMISVNMIARVKRPFGSRELVERWRAAAGMPAGVRQLQVFSDDESVEDLRFGLSSADPGETTAAMKSLQRALRETAGIYDILTDLDNETLELSFELLPEGAALGLTNREVISQVRNAVFGYEIQRVQRGSEEVQIRIQYPKHQRDSLSDLRRMHLRTPAGGTVPLDTVVRLKQRETLQELKRINGSRTLEISAKVDKEQISVNDVVAQLQSKVFAQLKQKYSGLNVSVSGEAAQEEEATSQLSNGFVLGLLLIYALLAIPLKSYSQPFIIMLAIPFGIVGAVLGHLITGHAVSLLSFFGILALSGVVVNDSLVLVSRYRAARDEGLALKEALLDAGSSRFRAVMLTSVTTFAGLLPLVTETSEQAQMLIPMAVSLAFGVLFATLITLIFVPVLLCLSAGLFGNGQGARRGEA